MYTTKDKFLITGATSGIGKATAKHLLEQGAFVIGIGRDQNKLNSLNDELNSNQLVLIQKDLSSDFDNLSKFVINLVKQYGKLRGCVLSAGIFDIQPLQVINETSIKEMFDINYFASYFLAKAFCDKRVNIGEGSSVVFLSSIASMEGSAGITAYSSTKGAINSLTKSLAKEVSKQKIRVNAVLPGTVITEMIDTCPIYTKEYLEELNTRYPLGLGRVENVVGPISFLLSDDARWITGTHLIIDGGASL